LAATGVFLAGSVIQSISSLLIFDPLLQKSHRFMVFHKGVLGRTFLQDEYKGEMVLVSRASKKGASKKGQRNNRLAWIPEILYNPPRNHGEAGLAVLRCVMPVFLGLSGIHKDWRPQVSLMTFINLQQP
jgi:hypothetical protein